MQLQNSIVYDSLLSVLIPAYEYPEGVGKILDTLSESDVSDIECIIMDDSKSDRVERVLRSHSFMKNVIYIRNRPPLGAISNWNSLLKLAHGKYIMILHHDEYPIQAKFFRHLCSTLNDSFDVLILDCFIANSKIKRMRRHFPLSIKSLIIHQWPSYLLRRNLIGAPSSVVIRREFALPFDSRLSWLVDVEWYYRLFRQKDIRVQISKDLGLVSVSHIGSITQSFGKTKTSKASLEAYLLLKKYPKLIPLNFHIPSTKFERILSFLEFFVWVMVRATTQVLSSIFSRPIPKRFQSTWKL